MTYLCGRGCSVTCSRRESAVENEREHGRATGALRRSAAATVNLVLGWVFISAPLRIQRRLLTQCHPAVAWRGRQAPVQTFALNNTLRGGVGAFSFIG